MRALPGGVRIGKAPVMPMVVEVSGSCSCIGDLATNGSKGSTATRLHARWYLSLARIGTEHRRGVAMRGTIDRAWRTGIAIDTWGLGCESDR